MSDTPRVVIDVELAALENEYNALAKGYKERYVPTWVMRAMVLMQKQKQQRDELATALQIAMDIMVTEIDEFEFPSSFETIRAALAKYRQPAEDTKIQCSLDAPDHRRD